MMLDVACFVLISKEKTSILFEDRFENHIMQVLVGLFVILLVVQDERVYFLLKFLSHVHHQVFFNSRFGSTKSRR